MKYRCFVKELTYADVEVEADSMEEAKQKAMELATTQPLEWCSDDGCYVDSVYQLGKED